MVSCESSLDRQPQQSNTEPDSENFQIASLCQTPHLLQTRTYLLFSSQPCFLLPPYLSFYSSFSKGTGSSSQPPHTCPACRPPGHFPPSPGHRELSNFSESLQLPLPLSIYCILYQNSLNLDSAELSPGICLNKLHIETGSLVAGMTAVS